MNTLPALLSKLQVKTVTPEIKALCELFDAYRSNCDDSLERMGKRLEALGNKLTRYESE